MNDYTIKKYIEENFTKDESMYYVVMGAGVYYEKLSSLNIHEWLKKYNCEKLDDLRRISSKKVFFCHSSSRVHYSLYVIDNIILCDSSTVCSDESSNLVYFYELEKKLDNVLEVEKMIKEMKDYENSKLLIIWNNINKLENEEMKYRIFKNYWNRKIYKNSIYIRDYKSDKEKNNKEYIISENDKKILELLIESNWINQLDDVFKKIEDITSGELTYKDLHQKIYRR